MLGWHQGHTSFKTLQFKHTHIHVTSHGNQTKGQKTLAAYVHQFKTEAKRCSSNSNTPVIHIFIKDLLDAHYRVVQICKEDLLTLSEVIKLVKNSVQHNRLQPPWHLLQSTWWPIMTDVLSVERKTNLFVTALLCSVTTAKSLATLPKIALSKSINQEHLTTKQVTFHAA